MSKSISVELCIERYGFDGTIQGAIDAMKDMNDRYYKPVELARKQYECDTMETERLQSIVDGFRLSKTKGVGGDAL